MNMHVPSLQRSLSDVVAEYDVKKAAMLDQVKDFRDAGNRLKMAASIGGTYGRTQIDTGDRLYESSLFEHLLKSAWYHVHEGLQIERIASPNDKRLFEQAMAKPPPFTLDNIRATFGPYIADPRGNILRGDAMRAAQSRAKGHAVLHANFLDTTPTRAFDMVVMNPPFYGKHYAKHVEHALKFLKPGGLLKAILPATARYDHGLLDGSWEDLPVGSFSESGTNINTTVLTIRKD